MAGTVTLVKLLVICVFPPAPSTFCVKVIKKWPEELKEELTVNEFACGPFFIVDINESTLADKSPTKALPCWPGILLSKLKPKEVPL